MAYLPTLLNYSYVFLAPQYHAICHVHEPTEFGNGVLIDPFFILVIAMVQVPRAIGLQWYVMPTTPHTSPKAHGVQLVRLKDQPSSLVLKLTTNMSHYVLFKMLRVSPWYKGFLNKQLIYLFLNEGEKS